MKLTDAIKEHINGEIESVLAELDLDSEVEKLLSPESMKELVQIAVGKYIQDQTLLKIKERIYVAIHKRQPIIDAVVESKVTAFMMGFTAFIDQLEADVDANVKVRKEQQ